MFSDEETKSRRVKAAWLTVMNTRLGLKWRHRSPDSSSAVPSLNYNFSVSETQLKNMVFLYILDTMVTNCVPFQNYWQYCSINVLISLFKTTYQHCVQMIRPNFSCNIHSLQQEDSLFKKIQAETRQEKKKNLKISSINGQNK